MAKMKQGIFGGLSGKVGNLTGSSWKGTPVVKSRPQSVAYPATTGQVAQTTKMSAIVAFCKPILSSWIKPLWDRAAVGMSGYNAFVKANIAEFADGVVDSYSTLAMSRGTMAATRIETVVFSNLNKVVTLTWDTSSMSGLQNSTDIAYACCINPQTGKVSVNSGVLRSVGSIAVTFPDSQGEDGVMYSYLAFKRSNGTVVSNNSFFGGNIPEI
jgi:hypothetical protein